MSQELTKCSALVQGEYDIQPCSVRCRSVERHGDVGVGHAIAIAKGREQDDSNREGLKRESKQYVVIIIESRVGFLPGESCLMNFEPSGEALWRREDQLMFAWIFPHCCKYSNLHFFHVSTHVFSTHYPFLEKSVNLDFIH